MLEPTIQGTCIEVLPNNFYKVKIQDKEYICYLSGKMRLNHIKVLIGDTVDCILDPYKGKTSNRIIRRI